MPRPEDEHQFTKPSFAAPPWAKPAQTPELKPGQGGRKNEEQEVQELAQHLKSWGKELKKQNPFFSLVPDKLVDMIADKLARPLVENGLTKDKLQGREDELSDLFNFSARAMNRPEPPENDPRRRRDEENTIESLLRMLVQCIMEANKRNSPENKFDANASRRFDQKEEQEPGAKDEEAMDPKEQAKNGAVAAFKHLKELRQPAGPTPGRRGKATAQPSRSDPQQSDSGATADVSFSDELGEEFVISTSTKNGRALGSSLRMVGVQFVPGGDALAQAQVEVDVEKRGGHTATGDDAAHHAHGEKSEPHKGPSPFGNIHRGPKPPTEIH